MPARAFAALGGVALLVSLFLPWYASSASFLITRGAGDSETISGLGEVSAWQAFGMTDVLLATLALAIVLLAFRRHAVVATVFAGLAAAIVILRLLWHPYDGLGVTYGIWIALAAALGALVAARGIGTRG